MKRKFVALAASLLAALSISFVVPNPAQANVGFSWSPSITCNGYSYTLTTNGYYYTDGGGNARTMLVDAAVGRNADQLSHTQMTMETTTGVAWNGGWHYELTNYAITPSSANALNSRRPNIVAQVYVTGQQQSGWIYYNLVTGAGGCNMQPGALG